jgi:four helix bundle protein
VNYKNFEELPCWQKARELCRAVSQIIGEGGLGRDYTLRDQIWRSAGSVMDNIAEGFDDGSPREFVRFLGS